MLELAHQGAQVMQTRAVELGWVNDVVIEVLSSFEDAPGTLIKEDPLVEQRNKVRGLAHDRNVAKVTLVEVPDRPGVAASVFEPLADAGINVDMIVQNIGHGGATDLSFTIPQVELAKAKRILEPIARELGFREMTTDSSVAKVSIVGAGIQNAPGLRGPDVRARCADAGVNIEMISTSEIRITTIIAEDALETALRALHAAFELERPEAIEAAAGRRDGRCVVVVPRPPRALRRRRLDERRRPRLAGRWASPRSASRSPTSRRRAAAGGPDVDGAARAALLLSLGFRPTWLDAGSRLAARGVGVAGDGRRGGADGRAAAPGRSA